MDENEFFVYKDEQENYCEGVFWALIVFLIICTLAVIFCGSFLKGIFG